MKVSFILAALFFGLIFSCYGQGPITITILYDNYPHVEEAQTDWGFSCLIEGMDKTILFDTGTKPAVLQHNIKVLGVDLNAVELITLSHFHGDHTGGLFSVLEQKSEVKVYMPDKFPQTFKTKVQDTEAEVVSVSEPMEMCRNVHLTGQMGQQIIEQAIVLKTEQGLILITGCAHPGIAEITQKAAQLFGQKIHLVLGGFHLGGHSEAQIEDIIHTFKKLGVQKVGATHCTGDKAIQMMKNAYGENFVDLGVGRIIKINN